MRVAWRAQKEARAWLYEARKPPCLAHAWFTVRCFNIAFALLVLVY
jgi:hypothetical protein